MTNKPYSQRDIDTLLKSLEENPNHTELVTLAQDSTFPRRQTWWEKTGKAIIHTFLAKPGDFYGRAFVSKDVKKHALLTAGSVSVSTAYNACSNLPLFHYAFKGLGMASTPITIAAAVLILMATNYFATALAAKKSDNKLWRRVALCGAISLHLLQSVVAAISMILLLDQTSLSQDKSQELIQQQTQRLESMQAIDHPDYEQAKQECQKWEAQMEKYPHHHPKWDTAYTKAYGTWAQRDRNWKKVPTEKLPDCRKKERLHQKAIAPYQQAKAEWQAKLQKRVQSGNDVLFLKREVPDLYQQHFTPEGHLRSGIEAAGLATIKFWQDLRQFNLGNLGFPLFFLCLSLITSGFACWMSWAFSQRSDVQKSFNDKVQAERDRWLHELYTALQQRQEQEKQELLAPNTIDIDAYRHDP